MVVGLMVRKGKKCNSDFCVCVWGYDQGEMSNWLSLRGVSVLMEVTKLWEHTGGIPTHSMGTRQSRHGEDISREEKMPSCNLSALGRWLGEQSGRQMSSPCKKKSTKRRKSVQAWHTLEAASVCVVGNTVTWSSLLRGKIKVSSIISESIHGFSWITWIHLNLNLKTMVISI